MKKHLLFLVAIFTILLMGNVMEARAQQTCNVEIKHPTEVKAVISGGATICYGSTTTITITVSGGKAPWTLTLPHGGPATINDTGNDGTEQYTYTTEALTSTTTYNSGDFSLVDANNCTLNTSGQSDLTSLGLIWFSSGSTCLSS